MTAKEAVLEILDQINPDASYEEIMYSIYVREKIELGLLDVETGNLATDQEVNDILGTWHSK